MTCFSILVGFLAAQGFHLPVAAIPIATLLSALPLFFGLQMLGGASPAVVIGVCHSDCQN